VVRIDLEKSFVIADIPGIIEGASEGSGLGIEFLKHLSRTKLLLHIVDLAATEDSQATANSIEAIQKELMTFDPELAKKERWLVFNKLDLIAEDKQQSAIEQVISKLQWQGPVHAISAITGHGTKELSHKIMQKLDETIV
jgi:GTP-binding protein